MPMPTEAHVAPIVENKPEATAESENWSWTPETKAQIEAWVVEYANVLHIGHYEISVEFSDKPDDDKNVAASTAANYPYVTGNTIYFYPRMLKWTEDQRRTRVIHELLHIVTDPLFGLMHKVMAKEQFATWREAKEMNEVVNDHLATVIAKLTSKFEAQNPTT